MNSTAELWDELKRRVKNHPSPVEQKGKCNEEPLVKETTGKKFPVEESRHLIQEAPGVPEKTDPNENTSRHTVIRMTKGKGRRPNTARFKKALRCKGKSLRCTADLRNGTPHQERKVGYGFQSLPAEARETAQQVGCLPCSWQSPASHMVLQALPGDIPQQRARREP